MATLPSISSLLQMAGNNHSSLGSPVKGMGIESLNCRDCNEQSEDQDIPRPLTSEVVRLALSELPNGTAQALHSCMSAYKMKRLSAPELVAFVRSISSQSKALSAVFPEAQVSMGDKLSMPLGPLMLAAPSSLPGLDLSFNKAPMLNLPFQLPGGGNSPLLAAGAKRGMERENCESPKFSKTVVKDEFPTGRTQTAGETNPEGTPVERQACAVQALMDLMSHAPTDASPDVGPPAINLPPPLAIPSSPNGGMKSLASLHLPSMTSPSLSVPAGPHVAAPESAAASPPQPQSVDAVPDKVDSPAQLAKMMDSTKLEQDIVGPASPTSPNTGNQCGNGNSEDGSAHNKYCHFCQHIKVKRASSMLACENRGCNRRFCEHCLSTHLNDARSSQEWRKKGVAWHCPICTKACCCTMRECTKAHRHCKAYRYRRKRAQQAEMDKLAPEPADHMAFFRPPPFAHAHMPPPHMHFMPYPGFACAPPPHHPAMHPQAFHMGRR